MRRLRSTIRWFRCSWQLVWKNNALRIKGTHCGKAHCFYKDAIQMICQIPMICGLNGALFFCKKSMLLQRLTRYSFSCTCYLIPADRYDVLTGAGLLAESHLNGECLSEFIRIVKPGNSWSYGVNRHNVYILLSMLHQHIEAEAIFCRWQFQFHL